MIKIDFAKNKWVKLLRFAAALIPMIWIFKTIDWHKMQYAIHAIAWWTAPLLFIVIISSMFLQGIRWWILINPFAPEVSLATALRAHFIGLYYSIVLPTSAAQDAVRAFILSKKTDYSVSWASTWVSRILGLIALSIMSLWGLLQIDRSFLPPFFYKSILICFALLFVMIFLSFSKRFTSPIRALFQKFTNANIMTIIENIREGIYLYRKKPGNVLLVFIVTMIMQILITVGGCLVIFGISGKFLLFQSLLFLPLIEILCISIPLTPNGIGVREGLLAVMFLNIGLTKEQLGIYIVLGFFSISLKLVGGIPLLFGPKPDLPTMRNQTK